MPDIDAWLQEMERLGLPTLLDNFCCEGGAAKGYAAAGFAVYGVDLFKHVNAKGKRVGFSQKRYPFPSHQGDAIAFIREHGHKFDARHASPPCQHATAGTRALDRSDYPALIEPTRQALIECGGPYVIENVEGADLIDPVTLCGTMFHLSAMDTDGTPLELWRHRNFETNWPLADRTEHMKCEHGWFSQQVAGCYGGARSDKHAARHERHGGYVPKSMRVLSDLMRIDWMTKGGMYQALPPIYTEFIGVHLRKHIEREAVAA